MKKGVKIAIVLVAGLSAAALSYYFLIAKPAKDQKQDPNNQSGSGSSNSGSSNSGSSSSGSTVGNNIGGGMQGPVIGKSVYANQDGVKILYKADATTYRIKNKNEFVGVIAGTQTISGSVFYTLGDGGLVVAKSLVTIK